jgi:3-methylcrotonyl-CoA carboxylase alpha subunit
LTVRLRFGEKTYEATVAEGTNGDRQVTLDGVLHEGRIETADGAAFSWRAHERSHTFHCVRQGDEVFLFWEGVAYRGVLEREGARPREQPSGGALEAPMPGKVIAVKVAPGAAVRKGDELLVVEAMKMENALRAPRDGKVRRVLARVGDSVSPGTVLVELE